jgi:hypothetical protein
MEREGISPFEQWIKERVAYSHGDFDDKGDQAGVV